MDVKQLWVIALKKGDAELDAWEVNRDLDLLETVRVNGELGLPIFTSRKNAEQYVQNEKCLQVEIVQPGDSVVAVAGFLQGMIEWKKLAYLVIDPLEAQTTAGTMLAQKLLDNIISELNKHAAPS
jgi:hypothetical protein